MSSEEPECDLPSWSCQTGPQPDPGPPLTGKLGCATGHGVLGRVAPRSPSEVTRPGPECFSQREALVLACVNELPALAARWDGLTAPRLENTCGLDTWAVHTGTPTRAPDTHRLARSSCNSVFPSPGQPQNRGGAGRPWACAKPRAPCPRPGATPVTGAGVVCP